MSGSWQGKTSSTYLLLLFSAVSFFLYAQLRPIDDLDLFMWLQLGRQFLEQGFEAREELNLALIGQDLNFHGWLWNVFAYGLYQLGGLELLKVVHNLVFALTPLIALGVVLPRTLARKQAAAALESLVIAFLPLAIFTNVRPQLISFLLFATAYLLLFRGKAAWSRWRVVTYIIILLVWQSVRMSTPLLFLLLLLFSLRSWIRREQARMPSLLTSLSLSVLTVLTFFFYTPGFDPIDMGGRNYTVSKGLFQLLEWMPVWEYGFERLSGFSVALVLSSVLFFIARKLFDREQWLRIVVFTLLAISAARFIPFWVLIMVPFWYQCLLELRRASDFQFGFEIILKQPLLVRTGVSFSLVILLCFALRSTAAVDPKIPLTCIAELAADQSVERVYSDQRWAGLIGFESSGRQRVAIDGRHYLRSVIAYRRHHSVLSGKSGLDELNNYDAVVYPLTEYSLLTEQLERSPVWTRSISVDSEGCIVFKRSV